VSLLLLGIDFICPETNQLYWRHDPSWQTRRVGHPEFVGELTAGCVGHPPEIGLVAITTGSDEVKAPALLITKQAPRHPNILAPRSQKRDLGHPIFTRETCCSRPAPPAIPHWSPNAGDRWHCQFDSEEYRDHIHNPPYDLIYSSCI